MVQCSEGHGVDSAIFCFHGPGVSYPSRVLGREARDSCFAIATQLGRRPSSNTTEEDLFIFCIRDALPCPDLLYTLACDIAVWLQFPVLNLVFQYYCSGVNVERVRGPTVSLGAVGPRKFEILTPAAQHNVLLCVLWKYGIN